MESPPLRAPTQLNLLPHASSVIPFYFWLVVVCWFADWRPINVTMYFSLIISSPLLSKPQTVGDGVLPHAPPSRASSPTFHLPTVKKKTNHPHAKCKNPAFAPLRRPPLGDAYLRKLRGRAPLGDVYLRELLPVEEAVAARPTVALGGVVERPQLKNEDAPAP